MVYTSTAITIVMSISTATFINIVGMLILLVIHINYNNKMNLLFNMHFDVQLSFYCPRDM